MGGSLIAGWLLMVLFMILPITSADILEALLSSKEPEKMERSFLVREAVD